MLRRHFVDDRICEFADAVNFDGHRVSWLQEYWWLPRGTNTMGCTRENHRAGLESGAAAQEFDK